MKSFCRTSVSAWVLFPVVLTPLMQLLLLEALSRHTQWPEVVQWCLAAALAMAAGLLVASYIARMLKRQMTKSIGKLARSIRVLTVNRHFTRPLLVPARDELEELVDEINRMKSGLLNEQAILQTLTESLQQLATDKSIALRAEVNAHKSAQEKLQSLARELDSRNRQLNQSLQLSQSADKAKAEFLANMSHELRTPLNAVLGVASLLDQSPLNDRQRQQLGMIFESGKALLSILGDIMDYVRIEAGEIVLDEFPFHLDELVLSVVNRHREEVMARGLQYEYHFSSGLPKLYLGDGARIQQVLNNVLDNAIKFTHEGSVSIYVSGIALQNRAYLIRMDVLDTGIGIADDMRDKLFKVFSQGDGSLTRAYGGSGLGLAITSRLVNLMQGVITLESEAGRGTLFRVEIPLNLYHDVVIAETALTSLLG